MNSTKYTSHLLIDEYIRTIVCPKKDNFIEFSPWSLLQNINLAKKIIDEFCARYDFSNITGICVLANSGIPIGVLLAQALNLPFYVYRRNAWSIEKARTPHNIFPVPPQGSSLAMVDSHIGAGYTSGTCFSLLEERQIFVRCVVAPITFMETLPPEIIKIRRDIDYWVLDDARNYEDTLLEVFNFDNLYDVVRKIKNRNEDNTPPTGVHSFFHKPARFYAILSIFESFFKKKDEVTFLNDELKYDLRNSFDSTESGVWSFFSQPKIRKHTISYLCQKLNITDYDIIVGTGVFGTFLSICLGQHNEFRGNIYSTYNHIGWENFFMDSKPKKCLICIGRLKTGLVLRNTIEKLQSNNVDVEKILVLRYAPELANFPMNKLIYKVLKNFGDKLILTS